MHFEKIKYVPATKLFSFTNHTLIGGKSGSGKSNTAEFLITQRVGRDKVIDMYDDGRFENALYGLPENNPYLISKMVTFSDGHLQPTTFPNEVLFIAGRRLNFMRELPKNINVVSLDQESLTLSDLFYLLGTSEGTKGVLGQLEYEFGEMTITELQEFLEDEERAKKHNIHAQSRYSILRNIKRWLNSGMFSDKFPKLDIEKVLDDKNKITSFSSYLLESEDEKALFYSLLLKAILDGKRRLSTRNNVILYIREISNFMGHYVSEKWRLAQSTILKIIREGRDLGVTLYADTQRIKDLNPTFRRQFGRIINMKSDKSDAQTLNEITDIPKVVLNKIPKLQRGQGIVVTGNTYLYPVFFPPARHYHKKQTVDIMRLLKAKFGTNDYSDLILESSNSRKPTPSTSTKYTVELADKEEGE